MTGAKLKALRYKLGLSLSQASRRVEVSVSTWCRWESGKQKIPEGAIKLFKLLALSNLGEDELAVVAFAADRARKVLSEAREVKVWPKDGEKLFEIDGKAYLGKSKDDCHLVADKHEDVVICRRGKNGIETRLYYGNIGRFLNKIK